MLKSTAELVLMWSRREAELLPRLRRNARAFDPSVGVIGRNSIGWIGAVIRDGECACVSNTTRATESEAMIDLDREFDRW